MKRYAIPTGDTVVDIDTDKIPGYVGWNVAQVAMAALERAYADSAVQAAYQAWKEQRRLETIEQ